MAVVVTSSTILKPAPCSPPGPSIHTQVPLTIFDRAAFDLHVPTLYAFRAPMPTNAALVRCLADVLCRFPHLAGRMSTDERHRPCFLLNNAGVRLVEARVDSPLADQFPLETSHELGALHPAVEDVEELLQVQLTRYSCGGLVLGVTSHHRVADGQSMSGFLVAWAAAVRGGADVPPPYLDRAAVTAPREPPRSEFNHRAVEFRADPSDSAAPSPAALCTVQNLVVHFTAKFITELKARVLRDGGQPRCSTFECLLAHLWKKTTAARRVAEEELTQVRVAVNGRARMKPPVPMEYFGNLVLWAYPRMTAGELLAGSHADTVKSIHDAVGRVDNAYFRSFADFGALLAEVGDGAEAALVATAPETGNMLCPNLEVDSWLRFNFHDLDFGTGAPCAMIPPNLPVEGLMVFVPSCKEKGGVDVFMALAHEHADEFWRICYSLD